MGKLTGEEKAERKKAAAGELLSRRHARKSLIDFSTFTLASYHPNWHHREIAAWLEKVTLDKLPADISGVMIFAPPRHGKSELVDIRWPAWDLGHEPGDKFIATAYGDALARTFSKGCRNVIESPPYQRLWRHKLKERLDTKWQLERELDDQRSTYIAAGILGTLTGEGARKLLIDDPVKNAEEAYSKIIREKIWQNYQSAANTRLAPNGRKVLVMTRWHEDDLAGRLLKLAQTEKAADQWIVVVLPATNDNGEDAYVWNTATGEKKYFPKYQALWPESYPREALDKTKANLGSVFWNALYQQRPTLPVGAIFKRENWGWFDQRPNIDFLIQVYDTAHAEGQENDYSASISLGAGVGGFPVLDAWRDKVAFPALVAIVYERWEMAAKHYNRYPSHLVIEHKGSGISLLQQLETNNLIGHWTFPDGVTRRVPGLPLVPQPATVSKVIRAHGISGYHESKLISLPRGADWVDDFVDELAMFDKGPHDDWVDVLVHGVTYLTRPVEESIVATHEEQVEISPDLDYSGFGIL